MRSVATLPALAMALRVMFCTVTRSVTAAMMRTAPRTYNLKL